MLRTSTAVFSELDGVVMLFFFKRGGTDWLHDEAVSLQDSRLSFDAAATETSNTKHYIVIHHLSGPSPASYARKSCFPYPARKTANKWDSLESKESVCSCSDCVSAAACSAKVIRFRCPWAR